MSLSFQSDLKNSPCCNWAKHFLSFGNTVSFVERGCIMTMSDGYRSQHIPLNGVAIKMITTLTIKKCMYEKPRQL